MAEYHMQAVVMTTGEVMTKCLVSYTQDVKWS